MQRNTQRALFNLILLPSGLVLRDCSLHERDGKRWIGLPARPQLGRDGRQLVAPKTGQPAYATVIDFSDHKARERFQTAALAAVDELISRGRP